MQNLYIIPGLHETCELDQYKKLEKMAQKKGYLVHIMNINWRESFIDQIPDKIKHNSTIFAFSLGGIMAHMITRRHKINSLILASMTPFKSFFNPEYTDFFNEELSPLITKEIQEMLQSKSTTKATYLYGSKEHDGEDYDILVESADHYLCDKYLQAISEIL